MASLPRKGRQSLEGDPMNCPVNDPEDEPANGLMNDPDNGLEDDQHPSRRGRSREVGAWYENQRGLRTMNVSRRAL